MNNKQKKLLKRTAQEEKPIFQLGKANLTEAFMTQVDEALTKREIVKLSILQNATMADEAVEEALVDALNIQWSWHIGHTLTLYRPSQIEKNQSLSLEVKKQAMK
ncbi:MAG: YhbY family RNA-binding protein [Aerococcus sp.]|nr:YhbY family RNA-binding protein [Aerococcus sp.]